MVRSSSNRIGGLKPGLQRLSGQFLDGFDLVGSKGMEIVRRAADAS